MGQMHNLKVGCGDATTIYNGETVLVDCEGIDQYPHLLPRSKTIHAIFVTHQHRDHYSGLKYLKENGYSIRYFIYSPYDRRYDDSSVTVEEWDEFESYRRHFQGLGAKMYKPYRQTSWQRPWWSTSGLRIWMLGPERTLATRETRELHDACLVFKVHMGNRSCLFTGDASDTNLQRIAATTNNFGGDILHASHHGSINGADEAFVKKSKPRYTVISTSPGRYDNVPHAEALKIYETYTSNRVYRTDVDGSLQWTF